MNINTSECGILDSDPFKFGLPDDTQEDKPEAVLAPVIKKKRRPIPKCSGLKIVPFNTNKMKIKQRPPMKKNIIPSHPSSVIFNGKSGSGKSNLVINLLTRPDFYGGKPHYFDMIYLFSPTAYNDDLVEYLDIPSNRIFADFDLKALDDILKTQDDLIKKKGILKSPKILILLDDIQSDAKFLRSKQIKRCFIQNRHLNISTWLCGQSFKLTPRSCRLQANNVIFFPCSLSEQDILVEEFCPPGLNKHQFTQLVEYATADRFNFLHIVMRECPKTRFRKNLDEILELQ